MAVIALVWFSPKIWQIQFELTCFYYIPPPPQKFWEFMQKVDQTTLTVTESVLYCLLFLIPVHWNERFLVLKQTFQKMFWSTSSVVYVAYWGYSGMLILLFLADIWVFSHGNLQWIIKKNKKKVIFCRKKPPSLERFLTLIWLKTFIPARKSAI